VRVYTYSEARQNLASLLDQAARDGEVKIKRQDGEAFVVKLAPRDESPLDVDTVDLGISVEEIVEVVRESRERG
jgi:PHD/YefM family antitoxin component YafN of YafNO toxin-antitoxin module